MSLPVGAELKVAVDVHRQAGACGQGQEAEGPAASAAHTAQAAAAAAAGDSTGVCRKLRCHAHPGNHLDLLLPPGLQCHGSGTPTSQLVTYQPVLPDYLCHTCCGKCQVLFLSLLLLTAARLCY